VRRLARLVLILPLLLVGCGSDSTGGAPGSGGKGGKGNEPDAGMSGGESNGGASGFTSSGGGRLGGGGSGAMSMGGQSGAGAGPTEAGTTDSATGGGGTGGAEGDAASGGASEDAGSCPKGSSRVGGKCLKDNSEKCADGTDCASGNCVGGACCKVACDSPAACQQLDGTVCQNGDTCVYGQKATGTIDPGCDTSDKCTKQATCFNGACVAGDPVDCSDTDACTIDTCDKASGCVHTGIDIAKPGNACDDNNACTTDTCDTKLGCQHVNSNGVKAGCNDNNPCTTDVCAGGLCVSTPMDCSSKTDQCHTGVCSAGACVAQPANVNAACTQGLDACAAGGKCSAAGVCTSTGNACGARSTACQPCTTGATCQNGRACTCATVVPPDMIVGGVCVANTDDCATNPCGPQATGCTDPTPNGSKKNDFVCTCAAGYAQVAPGAACTDVNECAAAANPCVTGACVNTQGSYDCTCASPLLKIQTGTGPQCACNLGGTYALVANTTVKYAAVKNGVTQIIEASPDAGLVGVAWALRYNTVDPAKGTVTMRTVACGGTTPDLCDTFLGRAHAQYQPNQVWGQPPMVAAYPTITTSLSGVVPSGAYTEPTTYATTGIALDNPAGAWPACTDCVGRAVGTQCTCGGSPVTVTNRAQWLNNPDGLGHLGATTIGVPNGGVLTTAATNAPPLNYTEPSLCPRLTNGTKYDYMEWPGVDTNGAPFFAYQWHVASRLQSAFQVNSTVAGQSISSQCTLTGVMTGPDQGHPKTEARVQGCEVCTGNVLTGACTPVPGGCSPAQVASYDNVSQTQQIVGATFTMAPAPAGVGDLGATLAMTDGQPKIDKINAACALVRAAYPATRQ
jgi:hypothetical protein